MENVIKNKTAVKGSDVSGETDVVLKDVKCDKEQDTAKATDVSFEFPFGI